MGCFTDETEDQAAEAGDRAEELQDIQLELIEEERDAWVAMEPYYLEQYGLTKEIDPETGEYTYVKTEAQTALDATNAEIESVSAERELAALSGELEVDPAVEEDIEQGLSQLKSTLTAKLGTGAEGSEAWNRAITAYESEANALRYSVRTGEISNYEAINTIATNNEASTSSALLSIVNPYASTESATASAADTATDQATSLNATASAEDSAAVQGGAAAIGTVIAALV